MRTLERERVLQANDLLDAIDEAEEENRLEAERERERITSGGSKTGRRR